MKGLEQDRVCLSYSAREWLTGTQRLAPFQETEVPF